MVGWRVESSRELQIAVAGKLSCGVILDYMKAKFLLIGAISEDAFLLDYLWGRASDLDVVSYMHPRAYHGGGVLLVRSKSRRPNSYWDFGWLRPVMIALKSLNRSLLQLTLQPVAILYANQR